jgi:hypothetical protein
MSTQREDVEILTDEKWDVQEVLETGEKLAVEHHNTVYHSERKNPDKVFKIFFRTPPSKVKENVKDAVSKCVPQSEVVTADLSDHGFEEDATVVVQEKSDYSVIEAPDNYHNVEQVYRDIVGVMDEMVSGGMINTFNDFKLEEFHYFGLDLQYVDFEDSKAFNKYPDSLQNTNSALEQVKKEIGKNYQKIGYELANTFGDDLDRVKTILKEESEHLDSENQDSMVNSVKNYPFR